MTNSIACYIIIIVTDIVFVYILLNFINILDNYILKMIEN